MRLSTLPLLLLAAVLLQAVPVRAQPTDATLYTGEVPVASDEAGTPLSRALNQVLVRVTGRVGEDLVAELGLDDSRAQSLTLATQFRDIEVPAPPVTSARVRDAGRPAASDRATRAETVIERHLRVEFDPISIDRVLDEASLPRWGRERPEMLLWIAGDDKDGAAYLDPDPILRHALERAEFRYGLPLTRPILDARDRIEVTPSDIRGGFSGAADAARARYGADGVVLLDLRRNEGYWTGRWVWRLGGEEQSFSRSGASPAEVVDLGLARIAGALAARFAVRPDTPDRRRVVVSGLARPVHYAEVRRFLASLTGVEGLRVLAAEGDTLTFELVSRADGLQQRIELSGLLRFVRHDIGSRTLYYALAL
ncbi:DUF2066 domain-containing protein [Halomonas denitrificans]|nr:DUF2066 domain-containing protein [Halomonas denitrificans]